MQYYIRSTKASHVRRTRKGNDKITGNTRKAQTQAARKQTHTRTCALSPQQKSAEVASCASSSSSDEEVRPSFVEAVVAVDGERGIVTGAFS